MGGKFEFAVKRRFGIAMTFGISVVCYECGLSAENEFVILEFSFHPKRFPYLSNKSL